MDQMRQIARKMCQIASIHAKQVEKYQKVYAQSKPVTKKCKKTLFSADSTKADQKHDKL